VVAEELAVDAAPDQAAVGVNVDLGHAEFGGTEEVSDDEFVDAFVDFESVFALPVTALLQQAMALIDVVLDFIDGVELEVDFDEKEGDVHFFTDFDGFFEGEVVGLDGLIVVGVGGVDLCFIEEDRKSVV
jgi:hypothetical protein